MTSFSRRIPKLRVRPTRKTFGITPEWASWLMEVLRYRLLATLCRTLFRGTYSDCGIEWHYHFVSTTNHLRFEFKFLSDNKLFEDLLEFVLPRSQEVDFSTLKTGRC